MVISDRKINQEELTLHGDKKDIWLLISGKVYDCTAFLDEHPGGDEVILAEAGKDATEPFEDVGHSDEARALLAPMYVGDFDGVIVKKKKVPAAKQAQPELPPLSPFIYVVPVVVSAALWYYVNYL